MKPTDKNTYALKEPLSNDELGMTLRDYFAAKAMSAIILDRVLFNDYDNAKEWLQKTAKASYEFADAMIVEREK